MGRYDDLFAGRLTHPMHESNRLRTEVPVPAQREARVPVVDDFAAKLPRITFDSEPGFVETYDLAWRLAHDNILNASSSPSSFVRYSVVDTAFNDCLFLWDTAFISLFAVYGRRAGDLDRGLYNFYRVQHHDGYICREIRRSDGMETFDRHDPSATGPNILAWTERELWDRTGDRNRLELVYPALQAYDDWYYAARSWKDGTCWSTGWASGMDNQPRPLDARVPEIQHGHMTWIDTTAQQVLSWRSLAEIAAVLGRTGEAVRYGHRADELTRLVNARLWNNRNAFYVDEHRDGTLSSVKTIGAYWVLPAGIAPADRRDRLVAHLSNPQTFGTAAPIPSLSADDEHFSQDGNYWCGGVWAPTNYMVLAGLRAHGYHRVAYDVATRHLRQLAAVAAETGTLWENYRPNQYAPGTPAKPDFVGWTGLSAIAVVIEFVLGITARPAQGTIEWYIGTRSRHGVERMPFGDGEVSLMCAERATPQDEPDVEIVSTVPVLIVLCWDSGRRVVEIDP